MNEAVEMVMTEEAGQEGQSALHPLTVKSMEGFGGQARGKRIIM